jgi:hypothetical protein
MPLAASGGANATAVSATASTLSCSQAFPERQRATSGDQDGADTSRV